MSAIEKKDGFMRGDSALIGPWLEASLAAGQQVTFQVSGDSMRPTLKPRRDAVVLAPMTAWPPRKGDILFFRSERSAAGYSMHRVIKVTPEGPIMNGDAQHWTEGPIEKDDVLARAIMLLRAGKPVNVDGIGYRTYRTLWGLTRPIRWPLFAAWRGIKRVFGPAK